MVTHLRTIGRLRCDVGIAASRRPVGAGHARGRVLAPVEQRAHVAARVVQEVGAAAVLGAARLTRAGVGGDQGGDDVAVAAAGRVATRVAICVKDMQ